MTWQVIHADCLDAMRELEESSVDAVVTDPPYGLHFMGKTWDSFGGPTGSDNTKHTERGGAMHAGKYDLSTNGNHGYQREMTVFAAEALRVLKPGGHLLSFGGTRTYHRLACALEDAGFEIRDCLAWLYGSGFPKSLDVSKAIDKAAGAEPDRVTANEDGSLGGFGKAGWNATPRQLHYDGAKTPDAERWQGWGTALKPAFEPIVLARKPLSGTVAQNVLEHGTGALNVDGTRIESDRQDTRHGGGVQGNGSSYELDPDAKGYDPPSGRWPANVLLNPEAAALLDEQSGESSGSDRPRLRRRMTAAGNLGYGVGNAATRREAAEVESGAGYGDAGGASRFFYTAKTSRAERERGVRDYGDVAEGIADPYGEHRGRRMEDKSRFDGEPARSGRNNHPTVKPVDLMQWLCRLITPPGGLILDPFLGSGSTGIAALREGFSFIGIEREAEYVEIARARIIGDAPLLNVGAEI